MSVFKKIEISDLHPGARVNARRDNRLAGLDELCASITARGLLQPLVVRPRDKKRGGGFEVMAGNRRLQALRLLHAAGAWLDPVPCMVDKLDDAEAHEASVMENLVRLPMSPLDQFEAFARLARTLKPEQIAERFGCPLDLVRKRLRLARVHPEIREAFREGRLSLDQLHAYAATEDKGRQLETFRDFPNASAWGVRSSITRETFSAEDGLALFVGLAEYEAAGGRVERDLFSADQPARLLDAALLERLGRRKLRAAASEIQARDGWAWVVADLSGDEVEGSEEWEWLECARPEPGGPRVGAVVSVGHEGAVVVSGGFILPADAPAEGDDAAGGDLPSEGGAPAAPGGLQVIEGGALPGADDDAANEPEPEDDGRLLGDLRDALGKAFTEALRLKVADDFDLAFDVALASLLACRPDQSPSLIRGAHDALGGQDRDPFGYVRGLPADAKRALFARVVSQAVVGAERRTYDSRTQGYEDAIPRHARDVAIAARLDMRDVWEADAAFFEKRTKGQIAATLSELGVAVNPDKLDKPGLVRRAVEAVNGRRWLPAYLRLPGYHNTGAASQAAE